MVASPKSIRRKSPQQLQHYNNKQQNGNGNRDVSTFRFIFTALAIVVFSIANYASKNPICDLNRPHTVPQAIPINPLPTGPNVPHDMLRTLLEEQLEEVPHPPSDVDESPPAVSFVNPAATTTTTTTVGETTHTSSSSSSLSSLNAVSAPSRTEPTTPAAPIETSNSREVAVKPPAAVNNGKGKLVLHIGPLKTGTTSIQVDLTLLDHKRLLQQDGWYYATEGRALDEATQNIRPMKELTGTDGTFIDDLKQTLDKLKGRNVIHSKEGWSVDFANNPDLYQKMHEALSADWDITIVSGYRPYFDWVVSLYSQTQKMDKFTYTNPEDWPWFEKDGRHVKTARLFPNNYEFWMSKLQWFIDSIVGRASPYFATATYNMNDPRSPSVAFVCDCLPGATKSCQRLIEQVEAEKGKARVENKGDLNLIYYDALGLAAGTAKLVDETQFTRYRVQKAIQNHVENVMHQTAGKDWPMFCPTAEYLDVLFEKSVRLEKTYMPQLWETNPNRHTELQNRFQKQISTRAFCHVDVDTMLRDNVWLQFFEQFQGGAAATDGAVSAIRRRNV
jgi:hypothetical protein